MNSRLLLALAFVFVTAACSRVTMENYQRLHSGMTYQEIKQILGQPKRCDEAIGLRNCVWGDEQRNITVNFIGDKAVVFASTNVR